MKTLPSVIVHEPVIKMLELTDYQGGGGINATT